MADTLVYNGTTPWGFIGTKVDQLNTIDEVITAAGMPEEVQPYPLVALTPKGQHEVASVADDAVPSLPLDRLHAVDVPRWFANTNVASGAVYGITRDRYEVCQAADAFEVIDVLLQDGSVQLDAAGTVRDGARCWVSARLSTSEIKRLDGTSEEIGNYLFFYTGFDGRTPTVGGFSPLRFRCNNQLSGGLRGLRDSFRIHHGKGQSDKLREASRLLLAANTSFASLAATYERLAQERMTLRQFRSFAGKLLDAVSGELDDEATERKRETRKARIAELETYFGEGLGNTGTCRFDGYNAITEWLDHKLDRYEESKRTAKSLEAQFISTEFGKNRRVKERALRMLA